MRNIEKAKERASAMIERHPHIDLQAQEVYKLLFDSSKQLKLDVYQIAMDAWLFGLDAGYRLAKTEARHHSHTNKNYMLQKQKEA